MKEEGRDIPLKSKREDGPLLEPTGGEGMEKRLEAYQDKLINSGRRKSSE